MRWHSIAWRLNAVFVGLVSLMLIGFGWASYQQSSARLEAQLETDLRNLEERLLISLAEPMWRFDQESLQQNLQAEAKLPVLYIVVRQSKDHSIYAQAATAGTPNAGAAQLTRHFPLTFRNQGRVTTIAEVEIGATRAIMARELRALVLVRVAETVILVMLIVPALSYSLYVLVLKPMRSLQQAIDHAAQEGGEQALAQLASARRDELSALVLGFNRIAERLSSDLQRRIAAEQASRRAYEEQQGLMQALEHSRGEAEEASRTKSAFLANMSHEIRTPMNTIIGLSDLALSRDLKGQLREYVSRINISAKHLLGIINDILDFSKIEAGKLEVESVPFRLDDLLANVANLVMEKASAKSLELLFHVSPAVPQHLQGDALRLAQILINFANNAVKFTERGEIVIVIAPEPAPAGAAAALAHGGRMHLRFSVRDTGIGLTPTQIEQLFQSFHQADTSTTRQYGGTGLGLSISKRLAELMGGAVGVDSQAGVGSTFWFTACVEPQADAPGAAAATPPRVLACGDFAGQRALVVDDNASARAILCALLDKLGIAAQEADSGEKALARLQAADASGQPFDWLLLDWRMPFMDGLETARQLRRRALQRQPWLVMVTGFDRDEAMAAAQPLGIGALLDKPVYETSLREALTTALAQQSGAPADLPASPSAALASMRHRLQGLRVLLVDDQEFNRFVGTELLQSVGFAVDTAEDGLQAVHQVQRAAYDVVLMDMQMPVMDGIRATQEIRKLRALDGLPILAMTANAMQHDKDACLAAGMVAVVTKPIVPDELWEALTRWVRPRRQAVAVTAPTALARQSAVHAPAPPPVQTSALPQVPGLDMAGALRRIQHDTVFYRKLLAMYLRGQGSVQQDMQRAIEAQDWLQAERLAHSNKGVSASIGATAVQSSADQLEVALRQRQPVAQILSLVAAWEATLRVLLEQLEQTLAAPWASPDDPTQAGASTMSEPLPLLARLLDLLQAGESDALALWESDKERLRSTLGDAFESIDDAIRAFEFEVAAAAMQRQIDQKLAHT